MFTFRNVASLTLVIGLSALVGCAQQEQKIKTLEDENIALCQDKEILNTDLAATKSELQHCQSELAETQAASKQVLDKANKLAEQAAQLEKDLAAAKQQADVNAKALAGAQMACQKADAAAAKATRPATLNANPANRASDNPSPKPAAMQAFRTAECCRIISFKNETGPLHQRPGAGGLDCAPATIQPDHYLIAVT